MRDTLKKERAKRRLFVQPVKILSYPTLGCLALLLALCFLLFFWRLGDVPFYSRGEAREGLVVWEMYTSGDLILPAVNGDYIPFKPPLFHWVGVLTAKILGRVDEFSVRFPSALFGTLGVLLTFLAGARLWGHKAGMIAATVLGTSSEWWQAATIAQVDMTLAFFTLASLLLFFFLYQKGKSGIGESLGLAVLLGCATLAKGPLGIALPSLTILVFLCLQRDLAFLKKIHLFASAVLFLLVAGLWYGLAFRRGGEAFLSRQILDENLLTAAGVEGHYQPFYYFIPVLLGNIAPWSLFFPSLALYLYRRRHHLKEERLRYPLIWFACVLIFFSLSLGKRGVYILPLYPAAALLLGAWWIRLGKREVDFPWFVRPVGYLLAVCYLVIPGSFLARYLGWNVFDAARAFGSSSHQESFSLILYSLVPAPAWLSICLAVSGLAASTLIWTLFKRQWDWVFVSLGILTVATALVVKNAYYPYVAGERTLKPFMVRVRQAVDASAPLLFYRSFDYGAIFYAQRHIASYPENDERLPRPLFLLMWEEEWTQLRPRRDVRMLDISEGKGPVDRHHLILAEVKDHGAVQSSGPRRNDD